MNERSGHARRESDERTHRQQERPERVEEDRATRVGEKRHRDGQQAEDRGEPSQRDDAEIGDGADRGELVEMPERDRQHGELGGDAHTERAPDETARQRSQHDPGRRGERQLKAGIGEIVGTDREDQERGQREAIEHRRVALEEHGAQHEHAHHDRAQDRGLGADDEREAEHGRDGGDGGHTPSTARERQDREHGARDQRDVEARHGQDVIHARATEAVVDLGRKVGPIPEQQAAEEGGRGGGKRAGDGLASGAADTNVPARPRVIEGDQPIDASAGHDRHSLAPEELPVIEAAGIAKPRRGVEPHLARHSLTFGERWCDAVERHRQAATPRLVADTLDIEEHTRALGGEHDRLCRQAPGDLRHGRHVEPSNVIARQRPW